MSRFLAPPDSADSGVGSEDCENCMGVKYVHSSARHPDPKMRQAYKAVHGTKPGSALVACPHCGATGKAGGVEETADTGEGDKAEFSGVDQSQHVGSVGGDDYNSAEEAPVGPVVEHSRPHIHGTGFPFKRGVSTKGGSRRASELTGRHGQPAEKPPRPPGYKPDRPIGRGRLG